jgi:AraC-like DNA-binding protein
LTLRDLIPMTKATGFGALPELLEQRAGQKALNAIFRGENVPLEILDNRETRLPVGAMMQVFDKAARATGERTFGLDVGMSMSYRDYGLWMEYCAMGDTLGEALARAIRTSRFQQSGGTVGFGREGRYTIWRYYPPDCGVPNQQHSDHIIGPMLRFMSVFLGPGMVPAWLELPYPRDPLAHLIEGQFDCPIRFEQPGVGVAFDTSLLASSGPGLPGSPRTNHVTMLEVEASEARVQFAEPVQSIASILSLRLLAGNSDIEGTAQTAGLGVQTLQRMLRREGTSYRGVLQATRCLRAKALLRETRLSITEIGMALGYSDHANFTRAFTRWAGCPPNIFRKQVLAAAEHVNS